MIMVVEAAVAGITAENMTTENTEVIVTDHDAASLDGRLKTRRDLL